MDREHGQQRSSYPYSVAGLPTSPPPPRQEMADADGHWMGTCSAADKASEGGDSRVWLGFHYSIVRRGVDALGHGWLAQSPMPALCREYRRPRRGGCESRTCTRAGSNKFIINRRHGWGEERARRRGGEPTTAVPWAVSYLMVQVNYYPSQRPWQQAIRQNLLRWLSATGRSPAVRQHIHPSTHSSTPQGNDGDGARWMDGWMDGWGHRRATFRVRSLLLARSGYS